MPDPVDSSPSPWLVQQWVIAGIVSASSRFIPVPFVDDLVRQRCRRFVVHRTLASHDAADRIDAIEAFYGDGGGVLGGCLGRIVRAPLKLLLFPVRKIVALTTSLRGVPMEVIRAVLIGRTLDRYLRSGQLKDDPAYIARMRTAFESSMARMDFRAARATVADALTTVKGWKSPAISSAKQITTTEPRQVAELTTSDDVRRGADSIREVLNQSSILTLFADFDRRFDEKMRVS